MKRFCANDLSLLAARLCTAMTFFCGAAAWAIEPATCEVKSPPHRVALVELYTSEGCSSCPPADDWLRRFPAQAAGADVKVVPLALHVDYWNSIGWTDRFSDARYTARQNELAADAHTRLVYTPEVFLNGKELRNWSSSGLPNGSDDSSKQAAAADLSLSQRVDAGGHYVVDARLDHVKGEHGPVALFIALYQNNLVSQVKAGENSGATLHHAFATRMLSEPVLLADGRATSQLSGTLPQGAAGSDLGFAVFAEDQRSGEVLQAIAAPLCADAR